MSILTIEAYALDVKFEEMIQETYGVTIVSMEGAPHAVVFEGTKENLMQMVNDHWGYEDSDISHMITEV